MNQSRFPGLQICPEILSVIVQMPEIDMGDIEKARADQEELKAAFAGAGIPPDPLQEQLAIRDNSIPRSPGDPDIRIRHYAPLEQPENAPCLLLFHGGAFVFGDLDSEHIRCLHIAARCKAVVISVDYRLAPENPFPAGVNDCFTALVWAVNNAATLGIDPDCVAVGGASAGGALAAAVAQMARDRDGPRIAFQLLIYPVIDDRMDSSSMVNGSDKPIWNSLHTKLMWEHYLGKSGSGEPVSNYAAPGRATNLARLPPAFILTAEHDPLRDEALEYAFRLMDEGVSTELHQLPGTVHGFDMLGCGGVANEALDLQVTAFNKIMRPVSRTETGSAPRDEI